MKLKQYMATLAACLLLSANAGAQTFPSAVADRLQTVIDSFNRNVSPPSIGGYSVAVVADGYGRWAGATGFAAANNDSFAVGVPFGEPYDTADVSGIYSITKTFTAALIFQLVDEGRLNLEDRLYEYVTDIQTDNIDTTVTVRQLLTHETGITEYNFEPAFADTIAKNPLAIWTPEKVIEYAGTPWFPKGTDRRYSATNYLLLGMIAEKITDSSAADLFRERMLKPLGLNSTYFRSADSVPSSENIAAAHENLFPFGIPGVPNAPINLTGIFPLRAIYTGAYTTGGLYSTANDVADFGHALYNGDIISGNWLDTMLNTIGDSVYPYPGAGVYRFANVGDNYYGHTGNSIGYRAVFAHGLGDGVTIAILNNQGGQSRMLDLLDLIQNELVNGGIVSVGEEQLPISGVRCYPNPATDNAALAFELSEPTTVTVSLYRTDGRRIDLNLPTAAYPAGRHTVDLNTAALPQGSYIYRITTARGTAAGKLVIVK